MLAVDIVVFRSAKERPFAERKATLIPAPLMSAIASDSTQRLDAVLQVVPDVVVRRNFEQPGTVMSVLIESGEQPRPVEVSV